MSQFDFGNLGSPLSGTTLVDDNLEPWRDALHSLHSAGSRPSYAVPGIMWINNSANPWVLNIFDGSQDIPLGTINTTTNLFSVASDLASITGISDFIKTLLNDNDAAAARSTLGIGNPAHGQCRLTKSGSNVVLMPQDGNNILVNGVQYAIPSGGVSLAPTGAVAATVYNIYCYWDGTALQL